MFCIKCGKEAVVGNFCENCFAASETLFNVKPFEIHYCDLCGINNDEIKAEIERRIKTENKIKDVYISLKIVGNKIHATVDCIGVIQGVKKQEKKTVLVILRRKMCDMHVKLSGGYYEAMIQVRGEHKDDIVKKLRKLLPGKSVVDVENIKEGYNIKVMNKATASAVTKMLMNKYSVKKTFKLVGNKKGQKLYRNFYAVR